MSQQKHWFPGQPYHRKIFDFTKSSLEIKDMPDSFINKDELFMGNTYESDDEEEQYYIIGRNLVDGLYKILPEAENLFDDTPTEPANCCFTRGTRPDETCALFIAGDKIITKVGLNWSNIVCTENITLPMSVAKFSPIVGFMAMDKIIIGYVYQSSEKSDDCTLVFFQYKNGAVSIHHLINFDAGGTPEQCYIHINKNKYALFLSTKNTEGTTIHIGDIDEDGKFTDFTHTLNSKSKFISAAFSQDNSYLFYPDQNGNEHLICTLRLADNSITSTIVYEDYNMLKLATDEIIYGLNKFIDNNKHQGMRLYTTIEILPDSTIEIKEFISPLNGGYLPAEPFSIISA